MKDARAAALFGLMTLGLATAAVLGWLEATASPPSTEAGGTGRLCTQCHDAPHGDGEHAMLGCEQCHTVDPDMMASLGWSARGLLDPPEHGHSEPCSGCHEDDAPGSALATEGHRSHGAIAGSCTGCHSDPHAEAGVPACETCHEDVERHGATSELPCTTCHSFAGSAHLAAHPRATAELAGLELEAPVTASALHGAMDCRRCHDPHAAEGETVVDCEGCHRGHIADEIASAPLGHRTCGDCHEPHAPRDAPAIDCLRCHTYPESGHDWSTASEANVTDAMRAETRARITHEGNCATCHEPHTWLATETRCAECHESEATAIAALPPESHEACSTCHEPHEPRPTAARCASCHQDVHAASAHAPGEHRDCLSCHDAHGGRPVARVACASCHAEAHRGTMASASEHRDCLACHEEHAPPLVRTRSACADCHEAPAAGLAAAVSLPDEHRCASCHVPHTFAGDAGAVERCASCHEESVASHASHRGTCTECHEHHDAPRGAASACGPCHEDMRPAVPDHAACTGCHTPHAAASEALVRCTTCHAEEVHAAATWRGDGPHAGECTACHTRHDEAERASCESCHARQASAAHTGGHDTCIGCHTPHAARPSTTSGWWARCTDCHAAEASAVAATTGTHGECRACHEVPGTPRPTCTGCHERPTLTHTSHATTACATCHATHGIRDVTPSACLGCHEEQRDTHFPDAARCQSCHPFGG